jgi:hypothetical protein
MGNTKHDYTSMEAEFIAGDMTVRALAIAHGISPNLTSSVNDQARKRDWVEKRRLYRAKITDKALMKFEDKAANGIVRRMEVSDHAIEVIDEALTKMSADMKRTHMVERGGMVYEEPVMIIRPADIVLLMDRIQTALGKPSLISEERSFGITIGGSADMDTLKQLAASLRDQPAGPRPAGSAGSSPLPTAPGPRN